MTQSKKLQLIISLGLGIWCVGLILWPTELSTPNDAQLTTKKETVPRSQLFGSPLTKGNYGIKGFRLFQTKLGKKYWKVRSQRAEFYQSENYTFLKNVDAVFYSLSSGRRVTSKSEVGRSRSDAEIVELEGNVHIRTEQGYDFFLEKLIYDGVSHQLRSKLWVKMQGAGEDPSIFLEGQGLIGEINDDIYFLKDRVRGRKRLSNQEWLHIRSDKGKFSLKDENADFRGRVQSKLPKLDMSSQRLEIRMLEGQEVLVAKGNVKLKQGKRFGVAKKAVLDVGANQVLLVGTASVRTNNDKLEGNQIRMFMDEDRMEVIGAEGQVESET